jgi:hypothetical protein
VGGARGAAARLGPWRCGCGGTSSGAEHAIDDPVAVLLGPAAGRRPHLG